ncbi:MAG: amidohydrolase family protein [Proteobacteria bacterium]|nr:amidohydrolase family protein [Pseudomonadota bacterium]
MNRTVAEGEAPACLGFDPDPRTPRMRLPRLTCDSHHHIFGPYAQFPMQPERSYTPPEATLADYRRMCQTLGIERSVLVHPSVYGTDLTSLTATLEACRDWMRGVAVVDASVDDATLARLDRAGVRGVRFNVLYKGGTPLDQAQAIGARVARLGWHVQLLIDLGAHPSFYDDWRNFPATVVVDHMGHMETGRGVGAPGFQGLLRLLGEGRCWVKLSGAYRTSALAHPYPDALPFVAALVQANPERLVWGTDWPHPALQTMPNDGDLAGLVPDWLPSEALREQVLVRNPARLYGFD